MKTADVRENIEQLIRCGVIPPYVYTYPMRSAYRELPPRWDVQSIWEADFNNTTSPNLNLYIHVPFCRYKCGFCNLYTVIATSEDIYDAYVDALCLQLEDSRRIIESKRLKTVYIGGGTPSILGSKQLNRLFEKIAEIYPGWRNSADEVCIEATPDSIVDSERDFVTDLVSMGITRINMGVQSLKKAELKEAGRIKANDDVIRRAFHIVKQSRISNLSTDLIMGFVGQTHESWAESVEELVSLDPETISTYFLTVRPDAWFSKTGDYAYARDPKLYERYDFARKACLQSGYVQETNIRYKRAGRGGYIQKRLQFQGVPYLGIGAGARTYTNTVDYIIGGSAHPNLQQIWNYIRDVRAGELRISSGFEYTDEERIRKRMVLDLFDLDLRELEPFGVGKYRHMYESIFEASVQLGLLKMIGDTRVQLTSEGYKYRDILSWLLISDEVRNRDREFYSQIHEQNHLGAIMRDTPASASLNVARFAPAVSEPVQTAGVEKESSPVA